MLRLGRAVKQVCRAPVQDVGKAITMLQDMMETQPTSVDQTHINILAELYMQAGDYSSVGGIIARAVALAPDQELPIDLQVWPFMRL